MDKLDPKTDGASADITAENIAALKALFPECVTEGKVDFEVLRELLGSAIEDRPERYSFNWNGKSRARRIAQTPSTGTLRPCREESVNWDTTQNIFIEGDNLEVLKLLQKRYHKRVKMIYIDPPYNTGNEFIYPDRYQDNLDTYLRYTNQKDSEGFVTSANKETTGRFHTNWLNMMYPRLKLARNLLEDAGVIWISIGNDEVVNLKKLCDEIFGEENFVSAVVWQRSKRGDAKLIANIHEYVLVYVRDLVSTLEKGLWRKQKPGAAEVLSYYDQVRTRFGADHESVRQEMMSWYRSLNDEDPRKKHKHYNWSDDRGLYFADNFAGPDDGRKSRPRHDLLHPVTGKPCKVPSTGWRWDEKKMLWALAQTPPRIHFGPDETTVPNRKSYLSEISSEPYSSVFYADGRSATLEVESLVGDGVFPFPKNVDVLQEFIRLTTVPDSIIMDFFAGSCSCAAAALNLNQEDGGKRRFIMIQLPEACSPESKAAAAGYANIADIGKTRLCNTIKNSKQPSFGFKAFELADSNIRAWNAVFDNLEPSLLDAVENIKRDRSELDILYELLLKYGLDLAVPVEEREIAGKTVYVVGAGALIVCLADGVTLEVAEGIAVLKTELQPEITRVVFKDAGFPNDVVKTNTVQILRQAGIDDVKSL